VKAVLLAGGLGTRMREETEFRPKPMVEIGGYPILWHIMRHLADHQVTDFIVASGYLSEVIDRHFLDSPAWRQLDDPAPGALSFAGTGEESGWTVTVAFTGDETATGGRVRRVAPLLGDERFFVTYGDGLADVDISSLVSLHERHGRLATLTAVQPTSRYGLTDIDDDGRVTHFREKPKMDDWVSIGFFVFESGVLDYLAGDGGLEEEGLTRLAADGELSAYRHHGFWQPMDTYREYVMLQQLWNDGDPPWRGGRAL